MTLKSMTGFARSDGVHGDVRWHWEGRSVNGRSLDLRFRLPSGLDGLETAARHLCQAKFGRGNCSISLGLQREASGTTIRLNPAALRQALAVAAAAQEMAAMDSPSLDTLLAMRGVVETVEAEEDEAAKLAFSQALIEGLSRMLDGLDAARAAEGERLRQVISAQLEEIAGLVGRAAAASVQQVEAISARLREQVAKLSEAGMTLDPARLHQEAVLLASKGDIQEELDRLRAHIEAARDLLADDKPAGRKLEFLAQEFNREANTICSKAADIEITRIGLELKAVIDQFREQVANIE